MPGLPGEPDVRAASPGGERLESWKEIAAYLKRDLRTVQRWEKSEGLPVHRHVHNKLSTVHAYTAELEAWRIARRAERSPDRVEPSRDSPASGRWIRAAGLAGILALAALAMWRFVPRSTPKPAWKVVPITTYPGIEAYPSFSPDGKQVAFTWNGEKQNQFDVYVKFVGPGDPLRLTNDPAEELFPTWSPDGRWIAFLRPVRGSVRAVCIVGALGGPERKLGEADGLSDPAAPSPFLTWAPDSRGVIVVDRERPEDAASLFLLSLDSGEKRRLTRAPGWFDSSPAVAPDGRALAFVRLEQGVRHSVYLQPLSEDFTPRGEPQRLTSEKWGVSNLSWTADSRTILCSNYEERNRGLWKIASTGGPAEPVPSIGESLRQLAISRQGKRLLYTERDDNSDIWRLDLGSDEPHAVRIVASTQAEMTPHLSPDGKSIAYVSLQSGHHEVWISNTDGTNSRQLTRFQGPFLLAPRWSPDGKEIAFAAGAESSSDIYVISADGGKPRRVTTDPASDVLPDWSADGRWLYFTSTLGRDSQEVWKVSAAGGAPSQVTRQKALVRSAFVSPDGRFVYYKIGNPIGSVWRIPVDGGHTVKILDSVSRRNFQVMDDGIYFLSEMTPGKTYALGFYEFRSGKKKRVARIDQHVAPGFAISRDGKHLYYWTWEQRSGDIMMIENFPW